MAIATSIIDVTARGKRPAASRRGFTLAESLMASAILAVAVVGIVIPLSASHQQSRASDRSAAGAALARQLLDEIVSRPFEDPTDFSRTLGPEADETSRKDFDNVDDYHGYTDQTLSAKLLDGSALPWSGGETYQRAVSVEYRQTPAGSAVSSGDFAMVTARVTLPDGQTVTAQRLVCRYPREGKAQ